MTKAWLYPLPLRRGSPVMHYITSDVSLDGSRSYWLCTYHDFHGRGAPAVTSDYHGLSKVAISRAAFRALLVESRKNARRYRTKEAAA